MGWKNPEKKREYDKQWYRKNKEKRKESNRKYYQKEKERTLKRQKAYREANKFFYYKLGARNRGIEFCLEQEFFDNLASMPCHYCGQNNSGGIDRIDSAIGYLEENCVPCCSMCNKMKNVYGYDEFIEKCKQIAKNRTEQEG